PDVRRRPRINARLRSGRSQRATGLLGGCCYSALVVVLAAEKAAVSLVDEFGKRLVRRAGGGGLEFEVLAGNGGRPGHRGVRENPLVREPVRAGIDSVRGG